MGWRILWAAAAIALAAGTGAWAAGQLVPRPPGATVQTATAYLSGEAMNSRYRIVTSRVPVGKPPRDQWYLSVYAQNGDDFSQLFQSPGASDTLKIVPQLQQGSGTSAYFPIETLRIVGVGEFMGAGFQQAILQMHAAAADCGMTQISILRADPGPGPIYVTAQVQNPCSLTATMSHGAIQLSGPYYSESSPLCCPAKPHAQATLRYTGGTWVETPNYFALRVVPEPAVTPLTHPTPLVSPMMRNPLVTTPAPSNAPLGPPARARSRLRQ